ncbi:MAG: glycosyltransferase family 4 protein [Pseudomonadota bacterium]|nr:glycosyltransferase family 4 protein [Pseudomonadota bacterium]
MRVYVLTPSFPPTDGGQEKHLLELSGNLIAAGATVRVLTRRVNRDFPRVEMLGSVPVRRLTPFGEIRGVGVRAAPRLGLLLCKMLWRLLRDSRDYDIVLVSGFNFMPLSAIIAGVLTRKPCVVRPESPREIAEPLGDESRVKMGLSENSPALRALHGFRRHAARRVDRYIAISSEIRAGLERVGVSSSRIVAIPNGIAAHRFEPVSAGRKRQLRTALSLKHDELMLIYTGRVAVSKGLLTLIDVWRELAVEFPNAHLLIVGTGKGSFDDCEPALREFIAAHDMTSGVTLTGSVPNVDEYLQASDLFVFPSDYEGFSLSILEAMMVGLPMVTTRVGIAAELEGHGRFGLLVPPKNKMAFRDALRLLLQDSSLRAEMGSMARAMVQAQYSCDAEARQYLDLFAELIRPS